MKSGSLLPAAAALAFTIMACQPGAGPLSDDDIAAIRAIPDAFVEHGLAADWTALNALNTEDAVWIPPNTSTVEGRAAIRTFLDAFPTITEFSASTAEIDGRGDLAFVRGTFSMTTTPEGAPEPVTDTGRYVLILRRQPDGSWLVAADIWNSDQPLPE